MIADLTTNAEKLRSMARELNATADRIEGISPERITLSKSAMFEPEKINAEAIAPALFRIASAEYSRRKRRNRVFPATYFGEPAWDMLLDLYIHQLDEKRTSITSACLASNASATTALRWLSILVQDAMVQRIDSKRDGRVSWLKLTDRGEKMIEKYLIDQAISITPPHFTNA